VEYAATEIRLGIESAADHTELGVIRGKIGLFCAVEEIDDMSSVETLRSVLLDSLGSINPEELLAQFVHGFPQILDVVKPELYLGPGIAGVNVKWSALREQVEYLNGTGGRFGIVLNQDGSYGIFPVVEPSQLDALAVDPDEVIVAQTMQGVEIYTVELWDDLVAGRSAMLRARTQSDNDEVGGS
jgi:hypothetical protein